jgi:hypothetical protein
MRSFGGADIQLESELPDGDNFAASVALAASPQTYDWQVREALTSWTEGKPAAAGLAVGERQRYRGIGIMFQTQPISRPTGAFEGFGVDFLSGRWLLPQ